MHTFTLVELVFISPNIATHGDARWQARTFLHTHTAQRAGAGWVDAHIFRFAVLYLQPNLILMCVCVCIYTHAADGDSWGGRSFFVGWRWLCSIARDLTHAYSH